MTQRLLIIVAFGAIVSLVCFSTLHLMGGLDRVFHHNVRIGSSGGPTVTRDLPWAGAETLHISVPAAITYIQGPQPKFTVTGAKGMLDGLRLDGDSLTEGHQTHWTFFGHDDELKITITSPNTHAFHLSGADQLTLKGYDQDTLELHISGAAQVEGEGRAKSLNADMSGAGDLDLAKLPVDDAVVKISGAGAADIDPRQSADISISGAGHVELKTKPAKLRTHIAGFGSISTPDGTSHKSVGDNDRDDDDAKPKSGAKTSDKNDREDD